MKLHYVAPEWFGHRWETSRLIKLSLDVLEKMAAEIEQANEANNEIYNRALKERAQERLDFKAQHPRAKMPGRLMSTMVKPPDLRDTWSKLLKRRNRAIVQQHLSEETKQKYALKRERAVVHRIEQKKEVFKERMFTGRFGAMKRREQNIRRLIDDKAIEMGISLTQRPLDARLAELFEKEALP